MASLSSLIRDELKSKNLSLAALAQAIGVSLVSLRGTQAGTSSPNKTTAAKYAAYFSLPVEDILTGSGSARPAAKRGSAKRGSVGRRKGAPATISRRAGAASSTARELSVLEKLVRNYNALEQDELVLAVRQANPAQRALVARVLDITKAKGR